MDAIKLFAKISEQLRNLVNSVRKLSDDIEMEFGFKIYCVDFEER